MGEGLIHPAYFAGFFDADGAAMIHACRQSYNLTVRVNQTSREVLDLFKSQYGGKVQGPYERGGNSKPYWFWAADAGKAETFLVDALPFLVVKRERAELALQFRCLFKGENILPRGPQANKFEQKRDRILSLREEFYIQMQKLNQRGSLV